VNMDLAAIVRAMQARLIAPDAGAASGVRPAGVKTDSRKVAAGDLFFCIPGERFDGHDFAAQALEQGAVAVVAERDLDLPGPVLRVDGVIAALGRLARAHRDAANAVVVGITGSAGKTTVKEMLAAICSQAGATAKNHLNLNNQIGLPFSMLQATGDERFWVFEAGISFEGEMDILGSILAPDVALITNVGGAHTEGLGGLDGVARNKAMLFKHLTPGGTAVYNADYPELLREAAHYGGSVVRFSVQGAPQGADGICCRGAYVGPEQGGKGRFLLDVAGEHLHLTLPWRGGFMAENAVAAAAAAHVLGIPVEQIKAGLESASPSEHRFQRYEANGLLVVDDAYNANPLSMGQAIASALELAEGKPLALVLGEMRELGDLSTAAHLELGRKVAASGADLFIWRGAHGESVLEGLLEAGYHGSFAQAGAPAEFLELWRRKGFSSGVVLFKGSRGTRMEEFCDALRKELHA